MLNYANTVIRPLKLGYWDVRRRVCLAASKVGERLGVDSMTYNVVVFEHFASAAALLLRSHSTARSLRRWSFLIAACVAAMNYAHFAAPGMRPTAAAAAFGMLSLLSPWMWGLHSRRQARIQLLKERRVDDAGAEFSTARKRAFPIRTMRAYRWSIDHNVTDPVAAWDGYHGRTSDTVGQLRTDADLDVPDASTVVIPEQRTISPVRITSRVASWDVELAVKLILDGRSNEVIMSQTDVTAKPLQLLRRCVRFLQEGMDVDAAAARVPCSLAHVQRVKAAMGVGA